METDLQTYTKDRLERARQLDCDPDLITDSCIGLGVKYPELWNVIKRYILRGDDFYSQGGLSVLASTAWTMPLNEASDVLEAYFAKHQYLPSQPGRGGIALGPLKAVYAVGTTYGFDDSDLELRRGRMVSLLTRSLDRLRSAAATSQGAYPVNDVQLVEGTIKAMREDQHGFEPSYQRYNEMPAVVVGDTSTVALPAPQSTLPLPDVQRLIYEAVERLHTELEPKMLSPVDAAIVKHGYEKLELQLTYSERSANARIDDLQRSVDRDLAQRTVAVGERQATLSRWNVALVVPVALLSALIGAYLSVMLPQWLGTQGQTGNTSTAQVRIPTAQTAP